MNSSKRTSSDCAGREDVAVAHARPQHVLDPRSPVRGPTIARVEVGGAEARRCRRPSCRATRCTATGSRCVTTTWRPGTRSSSGPNCSRCWGDLSTQRSPPRSHWSAWRTLRQVAVRRRLVVGVVVVAPRRHRRDRLEQHRREVDREELDLLVHVLDVVISCMRLKCGSASLTNPSAMLAARAARIGRRRGAGSLALGEHRLEALPVGQRPQRRVGGHQVVQVGRARARQAADDDRARRSRCSRISGWRATRSSSSRRFFSSATSWAARG